MVRHDSQHATRKLPYHAIYFGRRNRLYTVFTNYPMAMALAVSALLLALYVGLCVASGVSDRCESRLMLRVVSRFARDLRYLVRKRLSISRRRCFREFLERELIVPSFVGLRLYLARFYRKQLGLDHRYRVHGAGSR